MLTRRTLLAGLAPAAPRKPNFLFIMADDHAGYVLGCDGNRQARTPHLDELARQGLRFSQHYCNSPVCTPSRQSLITGQMPHMAGVTRLPTPLAEDKPTLPRQFKKAGYTTGVFGKMHFNRPGRPGLHGFDTAFTEDVLNREWRRAAPRPVPATVRTKPQWRPFRDPARIWLNADKLPYPRYDDDMKASLQVRLAERFLEEHREQPFALWVSFHEPHSPYDFPIEFTDRFDRSAFRPPRVGPEDGWQIPLIFRDLSEADKQGIVASYYTSVEFLDRNIGRVLAKLRALGLENDTLVVYTADHGYDLGHHGRFEKHCGYDQALRVPLIMRWPGRVKPGVVVDFTEHVDLAPRLRTLLGLEAMPVEHGRTGARDHIFSEYLENEEAFIRTKRWKYIYCTGRRRRGDGYETDAPTPGPYERLFDLESDPGEFTDVARRNPRIARELKGLLLERFRRTHPEAAAEPRENPLDWYLRPRDV